MKFNKLFEFLGLLRESHKLLFTKGKAVSFITLLFILLSSFLLVMNFLKPILTDVVIKARILAVKRPSTGDNMANLFTAAAYDCGLFVGVEWIMMLELSLSAATVSILASAKSYRGNGLFIKKLLPKALKALKRPVVTWFYITQLDLGYFSFLLAFVLPLVLIYNLKFTISAFTIIAALALVVRIYLAVVWKLAIVVSVLEEKCGTEALGKAGQLIKGSKLPGFFLNFVITISSWVLIVKYRIATKGMPVKGVSFSLLLFSCIICLIFTVSRMLYTVLYYESKATHGEELELPGILLINEDAVS